MEILIKAQEAINKKIFKATLPLFWISLCSLVLWAEYEKVYFFIPAVFVFCYMIAEDYFYKQVDLRLVAAVFLLLLPNIDLSLFFKNMLLGILIFGSFFLTSCRIYISGGIQVESEMEKDEGIAFLPSLWIGGLIWGMTGQPIFLMNWEETTGYIFFGATAFLFIFLGSRYIRMKKREQKGEIVLEEGFGLGDVFVCVLGFGFLGASTFLSIIFIAFLVQIFICKSKRSG